MPYTEKIKQIAANFPGILERADLLNLQLIDWAIKVLRNLQKIFCTAKILTLKTIPLRDFHMQVVSLNRWSNGDRIRA
jgi:hypothetical protein